MHPKAEEQPAFNLLHGTKQKTKRVMKKTKKTEMLRRNGPVMKSVECSPEAGRESMVGKISEREIDFEPGAKERGS